ncbi:interferon tau-2-like [Podarcis raffonei]|uniref:interferon tau-2-like n=1 Tax=Podarcis raffonei TaxID=65483 RepID=UPI0023298827|nr:interferon tau-2-like [Podarcis raffonei]
MGFTTGGNGLSVCLVLVLSGKLAQSSPLSKCPVLHTQWNQMIQTNLNHLCRTAGQFPLQCISETTDFRFPLKALNALESDGAVIIVREVLQQSLNVLGKGHPCGAWNATCLESLQSDLYQQTKQLEACAKDTQGGKLANSANGAPSPSPIKVKRYFQRMNSFLAANQQSRCAWELVHLELKGCFLFITQLLNKLKE